MSDDLVERVAMAMREAYIKVHYDPPYNNEAHYPLYMFTDEARAAIVVVLEEAAKVAGKCDDGSSSEGALTAYHISTAIRALIKEDK